MDNTTVSHSTQPHSLADSSFKVSDIQVLLAIFVAFAVIGGFILALMTRAGTKRKEDQDSAAERTTLIMNEIKKSHDDGARDVRELSDKVKDGRTVIEKDIEAIKAVVRHDIAAVRTTVQGVTHFNEKNSEEITKLRDRMTAQETNSKHQNDALNKLESTVREKIDENERLDKTARRDYHHAV